MSYRLSNTAKMHHIEDEFSAHFKYPNLYVPNPMINGLDESAISIITSEKKNEITFAIWGILPKYFDEQWSVFQNLQNTLNVDHDRLHDNPLYKEALLQRRCLILVSGFFTYYLHKNELYPYYVQLRSKKPFALAGIYNQLKDGFLTCSLILSKPNAYQSKIYNSTHRLPLALDVTSRENWIASNADAKKIQDVLSQKVDLDFVSHPIAKEFHNIGITYKSLLEPVYYNGIPK